MHHTPRQKTYTIHPTLASLCPAGSGLKLLVRRTSQEDLSHHPLHRLIEGVGTLCFDRSGVLLLT
jgi:hypothetical protein